MADAACELRQRGGVRLALLVHDLLPATSPRWFADAQGEAAKRDVETLIAAADQIFAVSAEVVAELSARYGKSATLLMPADPELGSTAEVRGAATTGAPTLRAAPLADERTILSVGTLHPRKNLVALIRLWDAWAREAESAGAARESVPRLVLAGRRHPQDGELFAVLAAHPRAAKRVTLIHTADDKQLAELYRSSRFLVMPSLAEGWGLPVREALLAGRPSIATDAVPAATGSPFARVVPAGDEAALGVAIREWWESDTPERLSGEIQRTFVARTWEDVAAELAAQLSN
jgi:glycosyltransferase involved in cell wall biosynthesis